MDADNREVIVACWWEHRRLSSGTREQRKSLEQGEPRSAVLAFEYVAEQVDVGGTNAIDLLSDLIDAGPIEDHGASVGAGPLEDFIHAHGAVMVEELEALSRRRPAFREALSCVWLDRSAFSSATYEQLRALTS